MTVSIIIAIVPILISVFSLWIALKAHKQKVPRLKVVEIHPSWYGATKIESNEKTSVLSMFVATSNIRIKNISSSDISISDILLLYNGEVYQLVSNTEYYSDVIFYYYDDNGKITYNGSSTDYSEQTCQLPIKLGGYQTIDINCLFPHFPINDKTYVWAEILIEHAMKKQKHKIKLFFYTQGFDLKIDLDNIGQYIRSIQHVEHQRVSF